MMEVCLCKGKLWMQTAYDYHNEFRKIHITKIYTQYFEM
jgi:hypothetical protein